MYHINIIHAYYIKGFSNQIINFQLWKSNLLTKSLICTNFQLLGKIFCYYEDSFVVGNKKGKKLKKYILSMLKR